MTLNRRIKLVKLEWQNGSGGYAEKEARIVFANVSDIGVTTKFAAAAAERQAELQAICWRKDYESGNYTHVDFNGKRYRIESSGSTGNDKLVKLIIAKGG